MTSPNLLFFLSKLAFDKDKKKLHTCFWFCFSPAQLIRFVAIICLLGCIESRLVKRSYSDQSVRGYLTEVRKFSKKKHFLWQQRPKWRVCIFTNFHLTFTIFIQRVCWWNEVCKEEFQQLFRCKCPVYSYCRSPGRYYNAYCTMTNTGYIWTQPAWDWVPWSKLKSKHPNRVWTTRNMHIPK